MPKLKHPNSTALLFLLILVAAPIISFWPGTTGDFIYDDFYNLSPIGKSGGVHDFYSFSQFIFSGTSGPTGRPLSLASFLIDAQNWPTDAYSFKRTNILLHALNGILIFAVIFKIFQMLGREHSSALKIAFVGSLIWLIHPLHVSTVLYVIQRMTELAALFSLAGVWCYLHGRQRIASTPGPGYLWMSAGVVLFGVLALLSKENGVLLPLYIIVIEYTLLRQLPRPDHWRYWAAPMLAIPLALLVSYLIYATINHTANYLHRDFSLYERLLTEPRAILDYVGKIIFPTQIPTLNNDDFIKSSSLFSPFTTLLSIITLAAAFILSIVFNKRQPVLSFAILWFLAGHLLESSVLSLEIYFEHRSYLPMMGFALAAGFYAEKYLSHRKTIFIPSIAAIVIIGGAITWNHSETWGNNDKLVATWAKEQPNSARAQIIHAWQPNDQNNSIDTFDRMSPVYKNFPDNMQVKLLYITAKCQVNQLNRGDLESLINSANTSHIRVPIKNALTYLFKSVAKRACQQITYDYLLELTSAFLNNTITPPSTERDAWLYLARATTFLSLNKISLALAEYEKAFRIKPSVDIALQQARLLYQAGYAEAAIIQANKAGAVDELRPQLTLSRSKEIESLRTAIMKNTPH